MARRSWSGTKVRKARERIAAMLPAPCWRCGKVLTLNDRWVVGHIIEADLAPWLEDDPGNQLPECRPCSDRSGAIYGNRKRGRSRSAAQVTSRAW